MNDSANSIVSVLGLGTMGHGIVQAFASKGLRVHGFDESAHARNTLLERVRNNLNEFVRFGLIPGDQVDATLARITVHDSLEAACRPATFVVEAIREELSLKQALFAELNLTSAKTPSSPAIHQAFLSRKAVLGSNYRSGRW